MALDTDVLKRNLLDALERECKPILDPSSAEPTPVDPTRSSKLAAMNGFDDLMARTDRESLVFTFDVRNALKIAQTRGELRRLAALVSSAQMDLASLAQQLADKIAQKATP